MIARGENYFSVNKNTDAKKSAADTATIFS